MIEHLPEQSLHHTGITVLVRMRESVAARRRGTAYREQLRTVVPQCVTQIVQPDAVGELAIQQADNVAPWRKRPALLIDSILFGQRADHPDGDELAKLIEDDRTVFGWFWLLFHTGFLGRKSARANHFLTF